MTDTLVPQARPDSSRSAAVGRLFILELSGGRIHSMNPDGSDRKVIVTGCELPDGIAIDVAAGHIYWTNMGVPNLNDGSIERADLDGANRKMIVPPGATFTPKQIQLDKENGKLYWCDREGMRVMRCNLDGTQIETLVEAGRGDVDRDAVGHLAARDDDLAVGTIGIHRVNASTAQLENEQSPNRRAAAGVGSCLRHKSVRHAALLS